MIATRITALVLALFGSSSTVWAQQSFAMDFDDIPLAEAPPPPPSQDFGIAVVGYYDNDPIYGRDGRMPWDTTFSSNAIAVCSREQSGFDPSCFGGFAMAESGLSAVGAAPEQGSVVSFDFSVASGLVISKLSF